MLVHLWRSIFKQQVGCKCDIMDSISYFFLVFWHMQSYMSWCIISFFWLYLYFLNILNFFKYSCTNIFHRIDVVCILSIGSSNVLSPCRRQFIIWTNGEILFMRPSGTEFSEISIKIQTFSLKKMYLKMSSGKYRPFCLVPNVLRLSISDFGNLNNANTRSLRATHFISMPNCPIQSRYFLSYLDHNHGA